MAPSPKYCTQSPKGMTPSNRNMRQSTIITRSFKKNAKYIEFNDKLVPHKMLNMSPVPYRFPPGIASQMRATEC